MSERRDEYLLRAAFIVSTTGDWVFRFALPLLVLQLTGSALLAAFTYALEFVPYVLVGLFSGVVADRADRRRLMIGCDLASSVVIGGIALLCLLEQPPLAAVYVSAFLLACMRPLYFPAFQGFLVDRVAPPRRPVMNAWVQGSESLLNMLGPIAGVGVVAFLGPAVASAVNAVSFILSAVLVLLTSKAGAVVRAHAPLAKALRGMGPDLLTGFRLLFADPVLRSGTILLTVTNFAVHCVEANLVYVVTEATNQSTFVLGITVAAQGAGAVVGAAFVPRLLGRFSEGALLSAGMGALAVALALPAVSTNVLVLAPAWAVAGAATSLIVVGWFTYRQKVVDAAFMGRVVAVNRAISFAAILPAALLGGWMAAALAPAALFAVAGVLQGIAWLATARGLVGKAGRAEPAVEALAAR
ncbi:Predicted arabinose efflux permease, MFS family [Actinokineospora alba]|uniref:Predicted arabinose efflux permease, MFS family n=1 Tax=Actinokineospora alba TaxID=504798 RepID=A0A1H0FDC7_9PSEU|nr:MFS transporter [Actinokineospora alba]TDP69431.1 putative MFS family arabinose efflux permease [Actinokineospora alba]SDI16957.1 Predicted arabinose efflux permease, MFS family [Actinokineospora alba]SDN92522.1 Predicted arabinose efflux permease, MFS family [Actinokineospora alba]